MSIRYNRTKLVASGNWFLQHAGNPMIITRAFTPVAKSKSPYQEELAADRAHLNEIIELYAEKLGCEKSQLLQAIATGSIRHLAEAIVRRIKNHLKSKKTDWGSVFVLDPVYFSKHCFWAADADPRLIEVDQVEGVIEKTWKAYSGIQTDNDRLRARIHAERVRTSEEERATEGKPKGERGKHYDTGQADMSKVVVEHAQ